MSKRAVQDGRGERLLAHGMQFFTPLESSGLSLPINFFTFCYVMYDLHKIILVLAAYKRCAVI